MSDINSDLLNCYPWINKEFFTNLLRMDYSNENIDVVDFELKEALAPGENYASQMIRAKVVYEIDSQEQKHQSFIIKAAVRNETVRGYFKELQLFEKEIFVYQEILPKVEKLLQQIGDNVKLAPKFYDANVDLSYVVFEDLTADGYKNVNRRLGLSYDHFKAVFSKVAKWHAATAVLETMDSTIMDIYRKPKSLVGSIENLVRNAINTAAQCTETMAGFEKISKKLYKLLDTIYLKFCNACKTHDGDFNVLCHGDLWANNIMYNKNENSLNGIMVDFQGCYWGSPVFDITNVLFSSSHEDLNEKYWDYLFQFYVEELQLTLTKLNFTKEIPTLIDFHVNILRKSIASVPVGILSAGFRNLEDGDYDIATKFMNNCEEDQECRVKMIMNPRCRKSVEFTLKYFDRKGYFEA